MKTLNFDYKNILPFIKAEDIFKAAPLAEKARAMLLNKTGAGKDYLGWLDYPLMQSKDERDNIKKAAKRIKAQANVLLVIGIGGSFLGTKAALDILNPYFKKSDLEVIFVGNSLSSAYIKELMDYLEDKDFAINIISKSGRTLEPAISFRLFKELLYKKYPQDARKRIYATTDPKAGLLREMADDEGWMSFIIPSNIGGRYSVFTAVGLLPLAAAGYEIDTFIQGGKDAYLYYKDASFKENDAMLYALIRNLLYQNGKINEFFVAYEPNFMYFLEWLKQLLGESEGKNHLGIFPVSVINTRDLHSLGQYIQDGGRFIFETVFSINQAKSDIVVPHLDNNSDELNSLAGLGLDYINKQAMLGTSLAHVEGEVPNLLFTLKRLYEYELGYLMYFFMFATGISAYILGVNPFDQPGVENYKNKMMELLGR